MIDDIQTFVQENLYLVIGIVIGIVVAFIAAIGAFFYFRNNDETLDTTEENTTTQNRVTIPSSTTEEFTDGKVLNYYGGKFCPHSNVNSIMYNIVFNKLKEKYPEVNVNLFWGDERKEKFSENNVQFVPTLLNNENERINTKLGEDINVDDYSNEELEVMFLENIYNQL